MAMFGECAYSQANSRHKQTVCTALTARVHRGRCGLFIYLLIPFVATLALKTNSFMKFSLSCGALPETTRRGKQLRGVSSTILAQNTLKFRFLADLS
jgi:hypothetical protein